MLLCKVIIDKGLLAPHQDTNAGSALLVCSCGVFVHVTQSYPVTHTQSKHMRTYMHRHARKHRQISCGVVAACLMAAYGHAFQC